MVDLEPGELLFVPGGLAHTVENLTPSLAISMNYVDASNVKRSTAAIQGEFGEAVKSSSVI